MSRSQGRQRGVFWVLICLLALATGAHAQFLTEFRSLDGTGNNPVDASLGSANTTLLRLTTIDYEDGVSTPAGADRPSARAIGNAVMTQSQSLPNTARVSDLVWQWGQFLDHDMDLTEGSDPSEAFDIPVPIGDPFFDPFNHGTMVIPLNRSTYRMVDGIRQQMNATSAFIDASQVYGSDAARANALRTLDGTGRLKTSHGDLLPFNVDGWPNAQPPGTDPADFFLAGDVRANEQVALTAMHTLFVREHNYWADVHRARRRTGDEIYQMARAIVGAEMQAITYNEFLPALLGPGALEPYRGYDPGIDPSISNVFSTSAYRFGHSMLSPLLLRLNSRGEPIPAGHLSMSNAFFAPQEIVDYEIEPLLRGLRGQLAQEVDIHFIGDVRNFLFGPPGAGGFDLASLNIQRGRDHGLPGYNQLRVDLGLPALTSFADITTDVDTQQALAGVYASVDDIDAHIGALAEDHVLGAMVGETVFAALTDQFERLRDGDRFWYESYFPPGMVALVNLQTLRQIIARNTSIREDELQANVFYAP